MIKYAQGDCSTEELLEIQEALEYGYFGMAYKVSQLEKEIQNFLKTERKVVCVNTGTSALHISLDAIGVTKGDEVILPSFTFVATAQVITACGATPVFVDVNDKLFIEAAEVEKKISSKTKAIIVVHYNGQPADMDSLLELAKKYNIRLIEDAAHAFGSYYKSKKIGSFGDITCFSFDSIKVMTCGEGGAVVSSDNELLDKIQYKRLLGMKRASMTDINWKNRALNYDVVTNGFRYHMSNINAAIGLAQIKKVQQFIDYRRELAKYYIFSLKDSKIISFFDFNYDQNANFMMPVLVKMNFRDNLKQYLLENEIESNISYTPIHKFDFYSQFALEKYKNTENIFESILSLPMHTKLTKNDIDYIVLTIQKFEKIKLL